jgi:hypothetical protein
MKRLAAAIFVFGTILTGCVMPGSIFNTEPFVDARKDDKGNSVLLDTPRMWQDFRQDVYREITREKAGDFAQGRILWNDFWLERIRFMKSGAQENGLKYIDYIIQQRRNAGLPELEGYP